MAEYSPPLLTFPGLDFVGFRFASRPSCWNQGEGEGHIGKYPAWVMTFHLRLQPPFDGGRERLIRKEERWAFLLVDLLAGSTVRCSGTSGLFLSLSGCVSSVDLFMNVEVSASRSSSLSTSFPNLLCSLLRRRGDAFPADLTNNGSVDSQRFSRVHSAGFRQSTFLFRNPSDF